MDVLQFLPFVGILLVFWLLIIRPAQRRQREQSRMQSAISVGDQVVLTSGFYVTVRELHDDRVDVDLAPGTTVTVARGAIGAVVPVAPDETPHDDHHDSGPSLAKKPTDAETSPAPEAPEAGEN